MSVLQGAVSHQPWAPIFDVRRRPAWVQQVVLDLLKQLRVLRIISATLPSIHTLNLVPTRQLRVTFGDLDALCEATEYILNQCGVLGVAYGGPDDKGTLWIKFYKMLAEDRTWENRLQYVIWIDSHRPSCFALADSSRLVHGQIASRSSTPMTGVANCQQQISLSRMHEVKLEWLARWKAGQIAKC